MRKNILIIISCFTLLFMCGFSVVDATNEKIEEYKELYSSQIDYVKNYEMNMIMDLSKDYTWELSVDTGESGNGVKEAKALGVYSKDSLSKYLNVTTQQAQQSFDRYKKEKEDNEVTKPPTNNETLIYSDVVFNYYYDYENNYIWQYMTVTNDINYKPKTSVAIWNGEEVYKYLTN